MKHAAPNAAALIAEQRAAQRQAKARRTTAARLERKLLRDLDVRTPTPLAALPQHVNVSVRPTVQAYAGKVDRMRNVLELQPSNFKSVHAHVSAHFNHGAVMDAIESTRRSDVQHSDDEEPEVAAAEEEGKSAEPPPLPPCVPTPLTKPD